MKYIKILIFILSMFLSTEAISVEKNISYDDFVNLTKKDQIKVVNMIHDYLNEHESITHSKINNKKQTKHTYIKILDYFLSQAYANMPEANPYKCYYAGWISFVRKNKKGETYCVHPKRITYQENLNYLKSLNDPNLYNFYVNNVSKKYQKYFGNRQPGSTKVKHIIFNGNQGVSALTNGQDNCSQNENIACNPEIYGSHNGNTLCVVSKGNYGVNASYACDKALEFLNNSSAQNKQLYSKHMNKIINELSSGSPHSTASEILYSMYDTCLCKGESGFTNKDYSSRIFATRTCAGILSQTKFISSYVGETCNQENSPTKNMDQSLLSIISKADSLLNKNITDMRNIPFPDKGNQQAVRNKVLGFIKQDQGLFRKLSEENYNKAKAAGLCPMSGAPQSSQTPDNSLNIIPKKYILVDKNLTNLLEIKLKVNGSELGKKEKDSIKYSDNLNVQSKAKYYTAPYFKETKTFTGEYTPASLKSEFELGPLELSCTPVIKKNGDKYQLKINVKGLEKISGIDTKNISAKKNSDNEIKFLSELSPTLSSQEATIEKIDGDTFLFNLKEFDPKSEITVEIDNTLKFKNADLKMSCKKTIPRVDKNDNVSSCNIFINRENNEEEGKVKFFSKIELKDENDKEIVLDPNKFSVSHIWFDHSLPANLSSNSDEEEDYGDQEGSVSDDILDEEDEEESEDENTEEEETKKSKYAKKLQALKENVAAFVGPDDEVWTKDHIEIMLDNGKNRTISAAIQVIDNNTDEVVCEEVVTRNNLTNQQPQNGGTATNPGNNLNFVKQRGQSYKMRE